MRETRGDLWEFWSAGYTVCVPTNGQTRKDKTAVMGAGVAKACAERLPMLPKLLGEKLLAHGNHVYYFPEQRIITFPTKHHWKDPSDLSLIEASARRLTALLDRDMVDPSAMPIYMPKVGCGLGNLSYDDEVKPILSQILDSRVLVISSQV